MPQVPPPLRRERAARLRAAGQAALGAFLAAQIGRTAEILMESAEEGRTEHFARARLNSPAPPGARIQARIMGATGGHLLAEAA